MKRKCNFLKKKTKKKKFELKNVKIVKVKDQEILKYLLS